MKSLILNGLAATVLLVASASAHAKIPTSLSPEPIAIYSIENGVAADTIPAIKVPGGFLPAVRPGQTYQPPGPHRCGQTITVTPPRPGKQYTLQCPTAQN